MEFPSDAKVNVKEFGEFQAEGSFDDDLEFWKKDS